MTRPALGLIETTGIDGALVATRAASGAGELVIVSAVKTGDHMTVKIEGDWVAVQAAVEAGARAADEAGHLIAMHVIPRTDQDLSGILPYRQFVDRYHPSASPPKRSAPARKPVVPKDDAPPRPVTPPQPKPRPVKATPPPPREIETVPNSQPRPEPRPQPKHTELRERAAVVITKSEAPALAGELLPQAELEQMAVVKLRKYARGITGLPIKGREISRANKEQLLQVISQLRESSS